MAAKFTARKRATILSSLRSDRTLRNIAAITDAEYAERFAIVAKTLADNNLPMTADERSFFA